MSLDILSRSFRRAVFTRLVVVVVVVQAVWVYWARGAVLACLVNEKRWFLPFVLICAKWGCGFLAGVLSLVSAGGISSWFAKEGLLMEEFEAGRRKQRDNNNENSNNDQFMVDQGYKSVRDYDEGMEDDYPDEDDSGLNGYSFRPLNNMDINNNSNRGGNRDDWTGGGGSGVKNFLIMGLTINFGSIAQFGLTGWLAQMLWGALRNLDDVDIGGTANNSSNLSRRGFTGMTIGRIRTRRHTVTDLALFVKMKAKEFVTNNSDLGMSHVAAYFKSYSRAANDVLALVDNTGVEPIIHDDISTPMLSAAASTVSSIITLFCFYILTQSDLSDYAICELCFTVYFMVYAVIFTVFEPLRASIKAVYVCFAQNPQSLRHTFPLIFHRLSRISESGLMD